MTKGSAGRMRQHRPRSTLSWWSPYLAGSNAPVFLRPPTSMRRKRPPASTGQPSVRTDRA